MNTWERSSPDQDFGAALGPAVLGHDRRALLLPVGLVDDAGGGALERGVKLQLVISFLAQHTHTQRCQY